ncbi:hypothetical protein FB451DRAFT_1031381 [Mycena latifolia]|nr:hypothetical protein FB451DRAFT_1031381 [Mycena latifolia]
MIFISETSRPWYAAGLAAIASQLCLRCISLSSVSAVYKSRAQAFVGIILINSAIVFGPHAITVHHLDFGNLSWGWCVITALGWFDPDLGSHLILWALKLIIHFPPGSTILIPSAISCHSNVPIGRDEIRYSFTQYTAGGLFRWIRNGFKTDEVFELTATHGEKRAHAQEAKGRWCEGVTMYSTVDNPPA